MKLDLTANFIAAPKGLLSIASLRNNTELRELFLTGNPCTSHEGYRAFVVSSLPQLTRLDGSDVTPSERVAAAQARGDKGTQCVLCASSDAESSRRCHSC